MSKEPEDNKDVHTEHCCLKHGCKYRNKDCTVTTGTKEQSYLCEECGEENDAFDHSCSVILTEHNELKLSFGNERMTSTIHILDVTREQVELLIAKIQKATKDL